METFLGLDLGGTKLLIGEVDSKGNILRSKRYDSGHLSQSQALELLMSSLEDYMTNVGWVDAAPKAMGIGLIGRVDSKEGIWHQIDCNRTASLPLSARIYERFGIPCFIDNDVKSATKAELLWGVGKMSSNFLYINIGTGIASGAVIDGRLLKGASFNAGETGHMVSGVDLGMDCICGRRDCVELLASGYGLDKCARHFMNSYPSSLDIPEEEGKRIDAAQIFRLAQEGDPLCSFLVDNAAAATANLIMDLVRCFDPDAIVLGGGIIAEDYMYDRVLENVDPYTVRFVKNGIARTTLNPEYVGLLGAAANAIEG